MSTSISKQNPSEVIELWRFCEQYQIKPRHSDGEIAIWRLVYGSSGTEPCFATYLGTFQEAAKKLLYLAKRNNTFTPSDTGYSCKFQGFRVQDSGYKISSATAKMLRNAGGYVRDENIDY